MGLLKKIKKAAKKVVRTAVKSTVKVATLGQVNVDKALDNIEKKGLGAFTVGQITGSDRAKLLARREEAAAANEQIPVSEENLKPVEIPTMNMAEIEEYKKKKLLEAQARSGRRSTIMSDKAY